MQIKVIPNSLTERAETTPPMWRIRFGGNVFIVINGYSFNKKKRKIG